MGRDHQQQVPANQLAMLADGQLGLARERPGEGQKKARGNP